MPALAGCVFSLVLVRIALSKNVDRAALHRTDWAASSDWPVYNGSSANIKYSELDQVTPANVKHLRVVWSYSSTQASDTNTTDMKTNPLILYGTLYGLNPQLKLFALDAATGRSRQGRKIRRADPRHLQVASNPS